MAKEMDSVLKAEVQAHSVFDPALQPAYHGVPLPGSKRNRAAVSSDPAVVPQVNFTLNTVSITSSFQLVSVLVLIFSAKVIHLKLVSGGKDFIWPTAAVFGRAVGTPVGTGKPATHGSS